jgi:hypothetical protein
LNTGPVLTFRNTSIQQITSETTNWEKNMKMEMKHSVLKLAAVISALALGSVTSALAGTVGGSVTPINTLAQTPYAAITIGSSTPGASNALSDVTVVDGTIDNNSDTGWRLTIVSANAGKLIRVGSSGGAGNEILYTNIHFAKTGGTLGAGLTDPSVTLSGTKSIVTGVSGGGTPGTTIFNTGTAVGTPGTATTATVAYAYALKISTSTDSTLLGSATTKFTDTLTVSLANDF